MYAELIRLPTAKLLKVENPRFLSGGSKLDVAIGQGYHEKYGIRILSCYHSTEAGVVGLDRGAKAPSSVGKVIDGMQVRITSGTGAKVSSGKQGLIWVRGPSLSPKCIGPYQDVDSSASRKKALVGIGETDSDGWFRTGDLGKLDRNSQLSLTGREDDVVKVDGKRVALGEVEGCLESFPNVKEAQAMVVTDPMTGSMVIAKIVAKTRCHPEDIIDHCARNLAPYKVPRRIEFCDQLS